MPAKLMQKASGIVLLVLAIIVAIVAGLSGSDAPNPGVLPAILTAAFGIIVALYELSRS
jgi:peptidoglycan/LPS O-acetylase OafA/YrhL